jgi:hypothetical protein
VPRSAHEWMYISIKTTVEINIETTIAMQEMTTECLETRDCVFRIGQCASVGQNNSRNNGYAADPVNQNGWRLGNGSCVVL